MSSSPRVPPAYSYEPVPEEARWADEKGREVLKSGCSPRLWLIWWSVVATIFSLLSLPLLRVLGYMALRLAVGSSNPPEQLELSVKSGDWRPSKPVSYTRPHLGPKRPCGHSAKEARAAGCVFDIMNVAWMPWECYDQKLSYQFQREVPFDFCYADAEGKPTAQRIPDEKTLSEMDKPCWATRECHILHCTFAWKMMHRAVERGWRIESTTTEFPHTEHCAHVLTNRSVPLEAVITEVNILDILHASRIEVVRRARLWSAKVA